MASASGDGNTSARRRQPAAKRIAADKDANPVASQRELGRRLRDLRNALGLTVEQVGERLMCSATKISRLETGARRANPRDVRDLCRLYGLADQAEADELMKLARQSRQAAWWASDAVFNPLLGLEQEAVAITSYSMYHVSALLQTAGYAREIIKGIVRKIGPDVLDLRVEARMRRQHLLELPAPPSFRALLDEAVLRREVGGPAIMQAQLDKMLACIRERKATIQVIPFKVGAHASTDSNFDFLEFADQSPQRPVVYIEGLFANQYLERPVEVARYREALEYLRDEALNPRDSANLITDVRDGYKTQVTRAASSG